MSFLCAAVALSTAGMLLMPVFGLLLRFQPQFVHGLHVSASSAEVNCYIVGGMYGAMILICGLLMALDARGCFNKKPAKAQDASDRRNGRYGLPFLELESKEFVKAMEARDRRTEVNLSPKKTLELPTKFIDKDEAV
ncbi:hypothetical protein P3T76_010041 [Phytophthora citrophthora]|uniref:Uncharacterized protein n=1 Tax=Phytophthora citrophthora TaxID=4793 RepID=A0AAD9LHM3_9STRA|nr:hypothetical protein P3T76_010041 [Phytophthora citrophthora]